MKLGWVLGIAGGAAALGAIAFFATGGGATKCSAISSGGTLSLTVKVNGGSVSVCAPGAIQAVVPSSLNGISGTISGTTVTFTATQAGSNTPFVIQWKDATGNLAFGTVTITAS